jgi:hypothetical protein
MNMMNPPNAAAEASPQPAPRPDEEVVILPARSHPAVAATQSKLRWPRRWDHLLAFLVLVLAFLAASFPARNSDLWFHLATGRLLTQGQFSFGADPFAYTAENAYWACHAWLFDLGLYRIYSLMGGAGLVVLKALLITALAWILLHVRYTNGASWIPIVCTVLAILAMSPRLLVQPVCISYFFLGLTFWLLWRPHGQRAVRSDEGHDARGPLSSSARLSVCLSLSFIFVVWVNVDEWFFLGPVLVALFWLGERIQRQRLTPGWAVLGGLAACLINPHTFHAFTLPPELSPVQWTSGLRDDARFEPLFASPWQSAHLHAATELNASLIAYYMLTALGLGSFLFHRQSLRDWRVVVWLPFALLAAWQARAVPFFVVIAAPITALNWQDYLLTRTAKIPLSIPRLTSTIPERIGWLLLSLALLSLIGLTWLGWLSGYGREERHVAWAIQAEPSLERVTETLQGWRGRGLLPEGERVFALAPEVAQYSAWFCPEEKHFFDHRFPLFPAAARDYETVCRALIPGLESARPKGSASLTTTGSGTKERAKDWRQVLREYQVGIMVIYDREPQRLFAVLRRLAGDPQHFKLLNVAGQALIFRWSERGEPGAGEPLAFDADYLAFGPPGGKSERELAVAPDKGPYQLPSHRDFLDRLAHPPGQPSWESPAATVYLHYFEDNDPWQRLERQQQLRGSLCGYAASLAGLPALPSTVPLAASQLISSQNLLFQRDASNQFLSREKLGPFFAHLVDRSPALPLLAVRAARRAVAANPEDSNAWLRLGQAYLLLRNFTCERSAEGLLPPLAELRHVQIATALEQALRLNPDLEVAHHELANLYGAANYLDRALEHRREEVRLSLRSRRHTGETAEQWADRREFLEKDTAKLEELVQDRHNRYASGSPRLQGEKLRQADLAVKLGLARHATEEVLLKSAPEVLGLPGIKRELELLLSLGRAQEVRTILNDEATIARSDALPYHDLPPPPPLSGGNVATRDGIGVHSVPYHWPGYEWLRVLEAAAVGDYAQARGALRTIRAGMRIGHERLEQQLRGREKGEGAYFPGLVSGPPAFLPAFSALSLARFIDQRSELQALEPVLRAQQADLCVMEGLLAIEQGATQDAHSAFAEAQRLGAAVSFAGEPIAARYLGKLSAERVP